MNIVRGRTSQIVPVRAVDTNGIPKTGLLFNTSGLSCVYKRELAANPVSVTLATMTAGTWASGGFIEENSGSMPGVYELGIPDAAISASDASTWVVIQFIGTNVYFQPIRIDLVAYNPQVNNLDVAVSTRLATTSYTVPPTAVAIRTEIDSNSTKLDAAITSRASATDYTTARAAKLDNLDTTVSSRLASGSYTTPPTVTAIRTEMDTNSTKLANLDAAVSSRSSHSVSDIWSYLKTDAAALATTTIGRYIYDSIVSILAKVNLISSSTAVTVTSPVASDGTITVIRGDDYKNVDGRAISFTLSNTPDITGATVKLYVAQGTPVFEASGTVTSSTTCYVELTSANTLSLSPGSVSYDLQITLLNGDIITPAQGSFIVRQDVR